MFFLELEDIAPLLEEGLTEKAKDYVYCWRQDAWVSCTSPLINANARIEPGAIRDQVEIGDNAVIMMGLLSISVQKSGAGTMIDMGLF